MVKHIIFDLGNVLVDIHPELAMRAFTQRCNISYQTVKTFFLSDLHLDFMAGKFSPDDFYQLMIQKFLCNISQIEFQSIWNLVIGDPKPGIEELINTLTEQYTLSVCSNTDPWHWQVAMQKCSFFKHFYRFFLSFQLKMNKPNPEVFKTILNELAVPAEKCLFIDDTKENIDQASQFGIKTIWTNSVEEMRQFFKEFNLI